MNVDSPAAAIARTQAVLERRPQIGLHDDAPAVARWTGGMRCVSSHANGSQVISDMPAELGGNGTQVTPGWLFRAGLASCAATAIAIRAASQGVDVTELEVRAASRSDTRGVLGLCEPDGRPVSACPVEVTLHVRIAARGITVAALDELVRAGCRCSPVPNAVEQAVPVALLIDAVVS